MVSHLFYIETAKFACEGQVWTLWQLYWLQVERSTLGIQLQEARLYAEALQAEQLLIQSQLDAALKTINQQTKSSDHVQVPGVTVATHGAGSADVNVPGVVNNASNHDSFSKDDLQDGNPRVASTTGAAKGPRQDLVDKVAILHDPHDKTVSAACAGTSCVDEAAIKPNDPLADIPVEISPASQQHHHMHQINHSDEREEVPDWLQQPAVDAPDAPKMLAQMTFKTPHLSEEAQPRVKKVDMLDSSGAVVAG